MMFRFFFLEMLQQTTALNEKVLHDIWLTQQNRMGQLFKVIKGPHSLKI